MKEIIGFLNKLEQNNTKEWFNENRAVYQSTKEQFLHLSEILISEIRTFDSEIPAIDPKKCMFRIFRDVRFSKDKTPYKTNYGTFIARDGRKGGNPGYYIHMQPGRSFLGGGIYMPDPAKLKAIRTEIYNYPTDFIDLLEASDFKANFQLFNTNKLKTAPKGFPKDFEYIDLLRYKSYAPFMNLTDEQIRDPNLIDFVVGKFKILAAFNQYLNSAIDPK
ncbi:MAG: DUF2461 domain-containing protein [Prolixibacteraceae bacterium]|jgi:uncharacterized protein (TIGR02453 family)|nr:DUF2461 domain-containing protein [Prolixibacteraceae bacterium]